MELGERTAEARLRAMLAFELQLEEQSLNDEFRWLDVMGVEDAEYFLAKVNAAFTDLPSGFSFGEGRQPFNHVMDHTLEQISTVGGLISNVEAWLAAPK